MPKFFFEPGVDTVSYRFQRLFSIRSTLSKQTLGECDRSVSVCTV